MLANRTTTIGLVLTGLAAAAAVSIWHLGAKPPTSTTPLDLTAQQAIFVRPAPSRPPGNKIETWRRRIALGRRLFAEGRLSRDGDMSCATCHRPERALSDGLQRARGRAGTYLERNTPGLFGVAHAKSFFWDGRAATLEAQARIPIQHPDEMAYSPEAAIKRLLDDPTYRVAFAQAFPNAKAMTGDLILRAIATYERTLDPPMTRFDRWITGDRAALSPDEIAGFRVFTGKAGCLACHGGWRFTDDRFHDIGLPSPDLGRGAITNKPSDNHAFKTPTLRELRWTAPYMHDGSLKTLKEVITHYQENLRQRPTLAPELRHVTPLSKAERHQLVAFLLSLSSPPKKQSR